MSNIIEIGNEHSREMAGHLSHKKKRLSTKILGHLSEIIQNDEREPLPFGRYKLIFLQ